MNEKGFSISMYVVFFAAGLLIGTGLGRFSNRIKSIDQLTREYTESESTTRSTVTSLERGVEEQQQAIDELRASNQRLIEYNRNARDIAKQALTRVGETGNDISKAISISKGLTESLQKVADILSSGSTD